MSPAPVCPRVTLTIEVSEVLFAAIQITATMSQTTVNAFIGTALRQTQISFFAEAPATSEPDVEVLDVRAATPSSAARKAVESTGFSSQRRARRLGDLGSLQREILDHLLDAPTMSGVYDLFEVRKAMLASHHGPAVSRALHQLIRRGELVAMTPTSSGFEPDVRREGPVRFVRCAGGS